MPASDCESRTVSSPGAEIDITTTLFARLRNGSASQTARADSRVSFHATSTLLPIVGNWPKCGTSSTGRPAPISMPWTRSLANAACASSGSGWPTIAMSA